MSDVDRELSLRELQSTVDAWIQSIGVRYFSELTNLAVLMEEVGELSRIFARTFGDQSFKKSDAAYNLSDEMADILFVLVCLANQTGVDLQSAMVANLEKKTLRDRDRHRNNPKLNADANDPVVNATEEVDAGSEARDSHLGDSSVP
jgi:NTP pyrophosphatase (non-canonical NTP hydrolase)